MWANLVSKRTGLPFVVWISPRGGAQHDVRVQVSRGPRAIPSEMITVGIRPNVHVISGEVSPSDLRLLQRWIDLNRTVLVEYWDGAIESTEDAINAIRAL